MVTTEDQDALGKWLCNKTGASFISGNGTYIGFVKNGNILAVAGYDSFNGASVHVHIAIEGKINREFLWYIFHYPFVELKAKKLIGVVKSSNQKALKFDKHLGFIEEATIKDAAPCGDLVILTMTKKQCKFLTIKRQPALVE